MFFLMNSIRWILEQKVQGQLLKNGSVENLLNEDVEIHVGF